MKPTNQDLTKQSIAKSVERTQNDGVYLHIDKIESPDDSQQIEKQRLLAERERLIQENRKWSEYATAVNTLFNQQQPVLPLTPPTSPAQRNRLILRDQRSVNVLSKISNRKPMSHAQLLRLRLA
ncbi:MAG: hypothetical protein EOM50_18030 [Erysipelotrichia bacterium]|nr:hypothetical protein [Erysipelotrichia bacterium]